MGITIWVFKWSFFYTFLIYIKSCQPSTQRTLFCYPNYCHHETLLLFTICQVLCMFLSSMVFVKIELNKSHSEWHSVKHIERLHFLDKKTEQSNNTVTPCSVHMHVHVLCVHMRVCVCLWYKNWKKSRRGGGDSQNALLGISIAANCTKGSSFKYSHHC